MNKQERIQLYTVRWNNGHFVVHSEGKFFPKYCPDVADDMGRMRFELAKKECERLNKNLAEQAKNHYGIV